MRTLAQVGALLDSKRDALKKLTAPFVDAQGEPREGFPLTESKAIREEITPLEVELKDLIEAKSLVTANNEAIKASMQSVTQFNHGGDAATRTDASTKTFTLPAQAHRYRGTAFKKFVGGVSRPDPEAAFKAGMWLVAALTGASGAMKFCKDFGLELIRDKSGKSDNGANEYKVGLETVNASGGFLVPDVLDTAIIDLREKFGVFEPNAKKSMMTSDTKDVPRRTGGLTAYFVGEDQTITDSTKGWDRVRLIAKKIACLAKYSNELNEDAIIDIANDLAQEMAYAFASTQDDCGFNGDGTSTYGGIIGLASKFAGLDATVANRAGTVVASGSGYATDYSSVLLGDLDKLKGKVPKYARGSSAWYCNQFFYDSVMEKLLVAAGGVTVAQIQMGSGQGEYGDEPHFLGFPVLTAQKMPLNSAVNQYCLYFGSLELAALYGDRRQNTIAMSEHAGFANDELQIRGTCRFDINVHDIGNSSGTASARVPGPICGLITAAS